MELILNVGDKITAEVEKRDRAGRLKGIRFPNFKVMKTESFRFKGSEPNVAELPVSKEKEL